MGTFVTAVVAYGEEEEDYEEECYESEHLPPLLEDEENVSLADILSLRDSCLSEEEVLAVCVECVCSLQGIALSPLFHTLCITPDTLAFNAHGNVCFMEQLSDDPEGSFVPPEFDRTGSTFEGHVYSLGCTLCAALDFVIEPELKAELGPETKRLLEQMQQEKPEDRPRPQDILSLGELRLTSSSSLTICRKLSSIGRRVLSIESVTTLQDRWETSWESHWRQVKACQLFSEQSSADGCSGLGQNHVSDRGAAASCADISQEEDYQPPPQCHCPQPSPWRLGEKESCENGLMGREAGVPEGAQEVFQTPGDSRSQNSSPVHCRAPARRRPPWAVLHRSWSVPDSHDPPPALSPPPHPDISSHVDDLTEIGADEPSAGRPLVWNQVLRRGSASAPPPEETSGPQVSTTGAHAPANGSGSGVADWSENEAIDDQTSPSSSSAETIRDNHMYSPNNHMTKSMLCLNEESQDEWISLRELLSRCARPLSVKELWALCYTCLATLQTYIDFPAYLCLDTVYVGCEGDILFLKPKTTGSCDAFYLAPEYLEHGIVTEKACVYGVAAILWATAKFNLSPNQKLAMPRKLKRLLLEMAKRTPIERPTIVMAKKSCRDYLSRQGTAAEAVWTQLINRVHKSPSGRPGEAHSDVDSTHSEAQVKAAFKPIASDGHLAPVLGPIPHSYPFTTATHLPEAFTSPATHFIPIVLERNEGTDTEPPRAETGSETTTNGVLTRTDSSSPGRPEVTAIRPHASGSPLPDTGSDLTEADWGVASKAVGGLTQDDHSSSSSSSQTLVSSTPPVHHSANQEGDTGVTAPPNNCMPVFNNFLLHQDPQTGKVTLVPVQIATAQPFTGLDLSALPLTTGSVQSHISHSHMSDIINGSLKSVAGSTGATASHRQTDSSPGCSTILDACAPRGRPQVRTTPSHHKPDPSLPLSRQSCCPALLHVIALLREQFAYDGYMENGIHDLAMGQYIFSLRDLQFETFCRVITEKFYDLYWEEELLAVLYCTVNYDLLSVASNEQAPSKPVERASPSPQSAGRRDHTHQVESSHLDSHANPRPANSLAAPTLDLPHPPELHREKKGNTTELRTTENAPKRKSTHEKTTTPCLQERKQEVISKESRGHGATVEVRGVRGSLGGLMEGTGSPAEEAPDESPSEPLSPLEGWEELGGPGGGLASRLGLELDPGDSGSSGQLHHDSSVDMEDADSLGSNSLGALGGLARGGPHGLGCHRPAWALALHAQECFNQEVVRYAGQLGRHGKGSSSLEEKAQELHQQLTIETRNMRKTRNFHHKLLKQERKNKGSEAKVMLSKLKIQFEEQRTKVEFLDAVRKYLEVLCLDQQGVDVSLLPSLAKGGSGGLEIQPQDDPALLTLLPEARKGKGGLAGSGSSLLVSGTPLGLMSYLYARDAHIEGYIQQFLYTYRYFCKPEEVLQFLMETFRRVSGENQDDPSSDATKVFNRSLDLLHCWVEDCRLVDFPSKSGFQQTLTTFLCSEVAPLDCRGESLLAVLQGELEKRWSQGESAPCWGPDCALEDGDAQSVHALCRRTSVDDGSKKSFQWRLSRVVEPQPKEPVFSIAAVLPRPCYSSLLKQLGPTACLRAEERLPFSQQQHSAQHTAQQLTLLEQEMFHSCHPVHFLNSRAQGVKDKTVSRCVSSEAVPAEGAGHGLSEASPQESPLLHLLRYADSVTNWVSAEIVICDSVKVQTALLAKFLSIAKCCYESRNFATAMQILAGLENVIIRQLPAWKHLSVKVCEIIEELRAVQVFLRSDSLCLVEGDPLRVKPTLPDANVLALHLQQLEIGAFTLTTGAYKWPKLRTIGRVVSQVHAFQEFPYPYAADPEFQAYLRVRISHLGSCDVPLLAADNEANFHQLPSSDRHSRRIQETLRRVRATFQ
ncbi:kinase non-catalytic C-lobe domain-containing protein 1 [Alosa sapidissima]|uniref:kinase non-catalytic C-lobe domain-containing protein 1 n=1 Tax=Alosa sapidissima TaxID=34773 RepID=UPI001C0A323F|nr:kinase non-catalytic C-lobe domain-containing protein 1 [Alosa sapidissima]